MFNGGGGFCFYLKPSTENIWSNFGRAVSSAPVLMRVSSSTDSKLASTCSPVISTSGSLLFPYLEDSEG